MLSLWFFVTIAALSLLKPIRTASLLAHLGAQETPWVRLASVLVVAAFVAGYSRLTDRLSRRALMSTMSVLLATTLTCF